MNTNENTAEETEVTLSESTSRALVAALDATIKTSAGVAKAIRECFVELLPTLPWKDGKCTLVGAKATKALPDVKKATGVINTMLLKHERFTVPGIKADTVKLSDSIRNQIGQAKSALGLPKQKINRTSNPVDQVAPTVTGTAEATPMTASQMEAAEWSPDIVRHEIAQCIILLAGLQAGHDAVVEHLNRALQEAGCGELAIVAKPKAAPEKAVSKEDRKEMLKRLHEMQDLEDKLAAG